ncbi:hypothetical protein TWF696_007772 [Orbilia brochopaga]|uniref:Uncharacterized protein n=1 Tax=Orbilia brochopaga TaxID=3140254 RepID=A0AAV9UMN4_9PEZI
MLEYFTYRKFKSHQDAKAAGAAEVLTPKDEEYFEGLVESPTAQEVPLQAGSATSSSASTPAASEASTAPKKQTWKATVSDYATETYEKARQVKLAEHLPAFLHKKEGDAAATASTDKGKGKEKEHSPSKDPADKHKEKEKEKDKDKKHKEKDKKTKKTKAEEEEYYANLTGEEKELHDALDALSLAAQDGKAFSLSTETREILKKFTQILKDMINGVPTAYDDLINLFETSSKQLQSIFDDMPSFLKTLTKKIPGALGLSEKALAGGEGAGAGAGLAAQAATLSIPTLKQIVTKPGVVADTLKTVVNAIKLRFPGIALGTNVILSMALFVLLFVFWYCWKRGKEVRLEKERQDREAEEAKVAKAVLEEAPPVPTTEPGTSATTVTPPLYDAVPAGAPNVDAVPRVSPYAPPPPPPLGTPQTQWQPPSQPLSQPQPQTEEVKPERQIKDLF